MRSITGCCSPRNSWWPKIERRMSRGESGMDDGSIPGKTMKAYSGLCQTSRPDWLTSATCSRSGPLTRNGMLTVRPASAGNSRRRVWVPLDTRRRSAWRWASYFEGSRRTGRSTMLLGLSRPPVAAISTGSGTVTGSVTAVAGPSAAPHCRCRERLPGRWSSSGKAATKRCPGASAAWLSSRSRATRAVTGCAVAFTTEARSTCRPQRSGNSRFSKTTPGAGRSARPKRSGTWKPL